MEPDNKKSNKQIIKIQFVISSLAKGGAERVISLLANYLYELGMIVKISLISNKKIEYKINSGVIIDAISDENKNPIMRLKFIRKTVKDFNPKVVISFLSVINIYTICSLKLTRYPVIVSERNDPRFRNSKGFNTLLLKFAYNLADGIVFQSKEVQSLFYKKAQRKSCIISNPLHPQLPAPFSGKREKIIVAVGRLEKQKNYPLLLKSFANFNKRSIKHKLIIYGDGSEKQKLKDLAISLHIDDSVEFAGLVDNIYNRVLKAGLFILSSDFEGMPNALMEAMALGLPCIATDIPSGSTKMLIKNMKNGILVPVNDISEMTKAITLLLENKKLNNYISKEATKIKEEYNLDLIVQKWLDYIDKI